MASLSITSGPPVPATLPKPAAFSSARSTTGPTWTPPAGSAGRRGRRSTAVIPTPDCVWSAAGRSPPSARLAAFPGVDVVGQVPDVRPYLIEAAVAVNPLRIARGLQNKVLEAMAMSKAVVASPQALAGLRHRDDAPPLCARSAQEWIETVGRPPGPAGGATTARRRGPALRRDASRLGRVLAAVRVAAGAVRPGPFVPCPSPFAPHREAPLIDGIRDARFLDGKSILITGGTGSLGNMLVSLLQKHAAPRRIIIFSRDEYKQFLMAEKFRGHEERLRFFLGDVRDKDRLKRAFEGVDYVIHAAALKQVPAAEYNPFEFVKTNVLGAQNVIDAAIDAGVQRVVALSTDKAANPINLYGATKLCSDKLFIAGNSLQRPAQHAFRRRALRQRRRQPRQRHPVLPGAAQDRRAAGHRPAR